jgi:putative ABC transport system ATP-binding protein
MTTLVELDGAARRRFGTGHTEVTCLHPTTLAVEAGELLAVMGPSGSGKTTLLSLVGGLQKPTEGRVLVAGQDVGALKPKDLAILRRRMVGYVFQDLNLLAGLTARENVSIPLEPDGRPLAGARAAAARALVGGRRILLADERGRVLDSMAGESVMRRLRAHCDGGGTVILVTHDATHAAWADRVVFIRDGRLVDEARPPESAGTSPS